MDGILLYDSAQNRFTVQNYETSVRALHCGDCVTIQVKHDWVGTRVEKDSDDDLYGWYFVDVGRVASFVGYSVRVL